MTTSLAPRVFLARVMCVITLTCVFTTLVPQTTIRSASAISSGLTPRLAPAPASQPESDSVEQKVECWRA